MPRRLHRLIRAAVWPLTAAALAVPLAASTPTFWTVSTQSDFLKGDVENLSIDADGRVFLGPETNRIAETPAPFIWTVVAASDGALWAGTGNEGQVVRVGRDGRSTTIFDAAEIEVHALAPAPDGGMYVGTSPDGKIYRVGADGKSAIFFDPDDKYIWALAVAGDGTVYAATGEKGVIYRIAPDGKGSVFYKTNSTNVVSLAVDRDGNVIAGTESPGRIFRIDRTAKAFVLLDSPFKEIHAVRLTEDGTIYAAAFSGTPGGEDRPSAPVPTTPSEPSTGGGAPVPNVTAEVTSITVVDAGGAGLSTPSTHESRARNAKGAIYRIRADGLWDTVWEALDDWPFDLLVDKDGSLLVGTGKEGKLFRVSGEPARATLIARAAARQITSLVRDGAGRVVAATSNPGKLVAIATTRAASGKYDSDVRDAGTVATWGALRWRASGKAADVQVFTRSGNTATPDDTWSPWSRAYTKPDGDPITSPNARYLQWRAVLSATGAGDSGPVLTSVTAAYLPRNLRPEVSSITVHPPGAVFQRPFSTGELEIAGFDDNTSDGRAQAQQQASQSGSIPAPPSPALGRKVYQKGLQTFVWKADDDNDDRLQYDVYYRREGETTWHLLKRGLWDPIFVWDTTSVPDGTYYVKVAASDAPSNSPSTALVGELESTSFDIDNTAPRIGVQSAVRSGAKALISFMVRDDQSPVQRVEYSLDASRWQVAYPVDGISDSREEKFEVTVDGGDSVRSVIIRASDAMNNVSTAVADIRRP